MHTNICNLYDYTIICKLIQFLTLKFTLLQDLVNFLTSIINKTAKNRKGIINKELLFDSIKLTPSPHHIKSVIKFLDMLSEAILFMTIIQNYV